MNVNVQDLRKIFSAQGIKGFSSANRAMFTAAIEAAEVEAYAEDAARTPAPVAAAPVAPKMGRSRAGMVIVAKGTEIHKSVTFKQAAEAAGWSVFITTTVDADENEHHTAAAKKGDDLIVMKWSGRAYDYPASSAILRGKARKVRNLKEALRLL